MADSAQIARNFMNTYMAEGIDAAIKMYGTEDFKWWALGFGPLNRDQLRAANKLFADIFEEPVKLDLLGTTAQPDRVAIEGKSYGKLKDGSGEYKNTYHYLFELRDERVCGVKEYHDVDHAKQVLGAHLARVFAA